MSSGEGTVSDAQGRFIMQSKIKDTLIFSSIQHKVKEYIVSGKSFMSDTELIIILEDLINELETVTIRQYKLSGRLHKDIEEIPTFESKLPIYNAAQLKAMGVSRANDALSPVQNLVLKDNLGGATTSIDFKQLFKPLANKLINRNRSVKGVDDVKQVMTEELYVEINILPETEYYNFIDFLNEKPQTEIVINTKNELSVLEYFIDQSLLYKDKYGF